MAPKKAAKASNEVHIVTIHTMVDSAFATLNAAKERLEHLEIDGQTDVKITTRTLKGGSVAVTIDKEKEAAAAPKKAVAKPKAAKAKAMPASDDNDDEDAEAAPAAAPKTMSVAKQLTEKAVPPPSKYSSLSLLAGGLAGKGHVFDDMSIVVAGVLPTYRSQRECNDVDRPVWWQGSEDIERAVGIMYLYTCGNEN
ncbi:hypothetical protein HYFRA_00005513 [Hymenoscyphus fraxineus]|uniref:Uncharacterized protein n=1 Tax=Hymenoscyphus fraxineus TaxID=746836 RepID=A0A9N9PQQ7_9HELO|nr:hypothetical protein HYFRA_00005513 [Hymenoscyphus fraxineus]